MDDMRVGGTAVLLRDTAGGVETLLIRRPARGSFAGAWVFPGGVVEEIDLHPGAPEIENASRAAVRETREEVGIEVADLVPLSQWTPPTVAPKHVRTWFFLAPHPQGEVVPAPDEVADWRWVRPTDALEQHAIAEIELFPPTWVTLHLLADASNVEAAVAVASEAQSYRTHALPGPDGTTFVWRGDREHPEGGTGSHRLETATRPWRYLRD